MPRCSCCSTNPTPEAATALRTRSASCPMMANTSWAGTTLVAAAITWARSGLPPTSCSTLGCLDFSLVPLPAARMAMPILGTRGGWLLAFGIRSNIPRELMRGQGYGGYWGDRVGRAPSPAAFDFDFPVQSDSVRGDRMGVRTSARSKSKSKAAGEGARPTRNVVTGWRRGCRRGPGPPVPSNRWQSGRSGGGPPCPSRPDSRPAPG